MEECARTFAAAVAAFAAQRITAGNPPAKVAREIAQAMSEPLIAALRPYKVVGMDGQLADVRLSRRHVYNRKAENEAAQRQAG